MRRCTAAAVALDWCCSACHDLSAAVQMILSLIVVSVSLAIVGTKAWVAWFILVFVCIYISAYAW